MKKWHHADQLQARIARSMGYITHADAKNGWLVWATEDEFTHIVIEAGL